ncbi:hypothetical protein KBG31_02005 [Patescibacteria group bacterium]|nr:hypothetical protein [Patescibacteria group bacterium]
MTVIYILLLIVIAFFSHLIWYDPMSVLHFSDWTHWNSFSVSELVNTWSPWFSVFNFGAPNVQLPFLLFKSIWYGISLLGFSYDLGVKISLLIPISLGGFVFSFFYIRSIFKNNFVAFLGSLFYGTTTYFLVRQTAHLPIAFVYAISPLIIHFFHIALTKNKLINWIFFSFIYFVSLCYEIRITYILTFVLALYFLFFKKFALKFYIKSFFICGFITLLLNLFWLFPTIWGGFGSDIESITARSVFGDHLFDITHSLTLYDSSWTGEYPDMNFVKQPINPVFWLLPILAFAGFFTGVKNHKNSALFFFLLSIVGIFLTKQNSPPLIGFYSWLYYNVPTFSLYREASKFYLLVSLGYMGLISHFFLFLIEGSSTFFKKTLFFFSVAFLLFMGFLNLKPLFTRQIGTMFVNRIKPTEYELVNNYLIEQNSFARVLWVPSASPWGIFSYNNPRSSLVELFQGEWSSFIDLFPDLSQISLQERSIGIFLKPQTKQLLSLSGFRYVIVPLGGSSDGESLYSTYGGDPSFYNDSLSKVSWLTPLQIGTDGLKIYENAYYKPRIYLTKKPENLDFYVPFEGVSSISASPTRYVFSMPMHLIDSVSYLYFSDGYNANWNLYLGTPTWYDILFGYKPLEQVAHVKNEFGLNTFDLSNINLDTLSDLGEVTLTLFFKPQAYYILGLIISGTTLALLVGYLLVYSLISIRKNVLSASTRHTRR